MFAIVPGIISIIAPPAPIAVPVPLDVLTGMPPDTAPTPVFEVLTGTPEADSFELEPPGFRTQFLDDDFIAIALWDPRSNDFFLNNPNTFEVLRDGQIFFNSIFTNEINKYGNDIYKTPDGANTFMTHIGKVTIQDFTPNESDKLLLLLNEEPSLSNSSEVDILVYQEADGPEYFPGFTDPLASSYILIENFDPSEDQIFVDGGKGYVGIMGDENDIPMTDDVQPAFVYNPSNPIFAFG